MRKLMMISAFVLASVSAQAGQSRSLILAANDEPQAAAKVEPAKPVEAQPEAAQTDVKADAAQPEASKPYTPKPRKAEVRRYESDEHKARRIAARYGVYW